MNNNYLQLKLKYNIKTQECFIEHSDVKRNQITNILENFISSEKGKGEDKRKANDKNTYSFNIKWFPSNDLITVSSDTGNYGLQLGILMYIFANFNNVCKDLKEKTTI